MLVNIGGGGKRVLRFVLVMGILRLLGKCVYVCVWV